MTALFENEIDPDATDLAAYASLRREETNGRVDEAGLSAQAFEGLSHADVLALEFPAERFLVDDLVPVGAVGTIAGVPETHKSWVAQALATRVAAGKGQVLGRDVLTGGPVGYVWQDDSTREEAERVKLFERVHGGGLDLELRWFLNEGVRLPDDLARLRATVEQHKLALLILDSFYNVLFGVDLKDDGAEQVVAALKREICDVTGCTVLLVDHMPWANDTNRQRLRAYGGVFKNAATRFGIYIDAHGKKLWIEARGNNMRGFTKTLAEWDADRLELQLVADDASGPVPPGEYEQRILDYLAEHPWATTTELEQVSGKATEVRAARVRLAEAGRIQGRSSRDLGRVGTATRWNIAQDRTAASFESVPLPGTDRDDDPSRPPETADPSHPSPLYKGTGRDGRAEATTS
jgi:hypothetical protein